MNKLVYIVKLKVLHTKKLFYMENEHNHSKQTILTVEHFSI